jgi:hypothetical protein
MAKELPKQKPKVVKKERLEIVPEVVKPTTEEVSVRDYLLGKITGGDTFIQVTNKRVLLYSDNAITQYAEESIEHVSGLKISSRRTLSLPALFSILVLAFLTALSFPIFEQQEWAVNILIGILLLLFGGYLFFTFFRSNTLGKLTTLIPIVLSGFGFALATGKIYDGKYFAGLSVFSYFILAVTIVAICMFCAKYAKYNYTLVIVGNAGTEAFKIQNIISQKDTVDVVISEMGTIIYEINKYGDLILPKYGVQIPTPND